MAEEKKETAQPVREGGITELKNPIHFRVEKTALELGLNKLREVWSVTDANPQLRHVVISVNKRDLHIKASDLTITAEVVVPLYEDCENFGEGFSVVGKDLLELVKSAEALISIDVTTDYKITVKTGSLEWPIKGTEKLRFGSDIVDEEATLKVSRTELLKAVSVASYCMGTDAGNTTTYGIRVRNTGSESSDGRVLFKLDFESVISADEFEFTVPAPMVNTVKSILNLGSTELVDLVIRKGEVMLVVGDDKVVFGQMSACMDISKFINQMKESVLKFEVDKGSFVNALKKVGVLGDADTTVEVSKDAEELHFKAVKANEVIGEANLPVTWAEGIEDAFKVKLNWKLLKDVFLALGSDTVKFHVGTLKTQTFINLVEPDRSVYVLTSK